ncbi:MAG: hypothetical protein ACYDD4_12550 [Acidimicrobiales bacterium]
MEKSGGQGRPKAGAARARWASYCERTEEALFDLAQEGEELYEKLPEEMQITEISSAIDLAELAGFWVAWHLAGGFAGLERWGWNRSTIFRKVRRFRAVFDQHPDTYRFSWLRADWEKGYGEFLRRLVNIGQRYYEPVDDEDDLDLLDLDPADGRD